MRAILLLCGLLGLTVACAAADLQCAVCQERISGQFYWLSSPALAEKQSVCEACFRLEAKCSICRLPVNKDGRQLADGRFLCQKDFAAAVFDEREGQRIYEETRRDVQGILAGFGALPGANIKFTMVDGAQLKRLNQSLPSAHDDANVLGLTRSRVRNKTEFEHDIYLITGLGPARMAAVAAHEYTHTWIHENVPRSRRLERDSVEGFCELVAYKLMSQRGEEIEKKVILANAYTRGQVKAFVQAENNHQFHRVIRWMKTGVDEQLIETNGVQVLAVRPEPSNSIWPPPSARPTPVPDELELKGISGQAGRRFALVNNLTLKQGDNASIRVGNGYVNVRCRAVKASSVVLEIEGKSAPVELFLNGPRLAGEAKDGIK